MRLAAPRLHYITGWPTCAKALNDYLQKQFCQNEISNLETLVIEAYNIEPLKT